MKYESREQKDALSFHWAKYLDSKNIETLVFGLTQSAFVLEGVLKKHFDNYRDNYAEIVKAIENDIHVDDLITGGINSKEATTIKEHSIELFKKGELSLHKWNSNLLTSEKENNETEDELTYAKQMLIQGSSNTKILGLECNKETGKLSIVTPEVILSELASVGNPIGLISPVHFTYIPRFAI